MRLESILNEAVVVHGYSLFAYAITLAEAFDAAPVYDPSAVPAWEAMIDSDTKLAQRVLGHLDVEYVKTDPYKSLNQLLQDVTLNHHLAVFQTQGTHPGMTGAQNDLFRALHDALSHVGANGAAFWHHYIMHDQTPYKPLWGGGFSVRGEMNAYLIHARMAPQAAIPALFTEIVGQICYYFVTNHYADNKVAILNGFDYKNVGLVTSSQYTARMAEIQQQVEDPSVQSIPTSVNDITIDKAKIHWKLLSPGTGAGNLT